MVAIEKTKCTGCGECVSDCVADNIKLQDGKAECINPCILCGHCVAVCPAGAVSIPEYDMANVEASKKDLAELDPDKLLYNIKARRSIRQYADKAIGREKLDNIVQAGRYTATGANRQACRFVVAQDGLPELKEMVWSGIDAAKGQTGPAPAEMLDALHGFSAMRAHGTDYLFRDAPAVLYIAAESAVDAALAAQNMELIAISQGLGVLYNGFLVYATNMLPTVRDWLDIQDKPVQVCMLVGYPRVSYMRTAPRRAADVRWR
jgi:nitroreductase/NAD-dependent dihydropyrimidine dehydrogenase PreA subunit